MPSTKPILILQLRPEDATAESEYQRILTYGQLNAEDTCRFRIEHNGIPENLDLDHYAAIIVGGSPFDISTANHKKTDIQKKIEADFQRLLEQVVKRDFPFFGACSGNGLLGHYLGAPITTRYGEAVGCVTLDITNEGKQDKLLKDFPPRIDVLLGHKEACDVVPEGATLLMTGSQCPVQMFRVGDNIYATQFHPEADPEEFALRIDIYANHGYFEPQEAEALKAASNKPTPHAQEILRRFVAWYFKEKRESDLISFPTQRE
ncbi:MAG: glutamine amidotransferase [Gammaproteobacteria bacterium]|nr:glutamine amidotransferase [Gammaproteobacteria bacterium]